MPYAGELIQVRDDERDWEGAAERLLRSFGLSLLVPDAHYAAVGDWVDRTHLKGRLVYFRVRPVEAGRCAANCPRCTPTRWRASSPSSPIRPSTPGWNANWRTASTWPAAPAQEQFRREARAITRAGQIKAPGERHEKDDRHRIDDRSRYVLGWSNQAKIAALEGKASALQARLAESRPAHRRAADANAAGRANGCRRWTSWRSTATSPNSTGSGSATETGRAAGREAAAGSGIRRAEDADRAACTRWKPRSPIRQHQAEGARTEQARTLLKQEAGARPCATADASSGWTHRLARPRPQHFAHHRSLARRGPGRAHAQRRILRRPRAGHAALAAGTHRRRRQEAGAPGARRSCAR